MYTMIASFTIVPFSVNIRTMLKSVNGFVVQDSTCFYKNLKLDILFTKCVHKMIIHFSEILQHMLQNFWLILSHSVDILFSLYVFLFLYINCTTLQKIILLVCFPYHEQDLRFILDQCSALLSNCTHVTLNYAVSDLISLVKIEITWVVEISIC